MRWSTIDAAYHGIRIYLHMELCSLFHYLLCPWMAVELQNICLQIVLTYMECTRHANCIICTVFNMLLHDRICTDCPPLHVFAAVPIDSLHCILRATDDRVCGTDGQTYSSLCEMLRSRLGAVQLRYNSRCDDPECTDRTVSFVILCPCKLHSAVKGH